MARRSRSPPREVRAVLLDMDDTLFDHSLTCREAVDLVRRQTPFLARRSLEELWREYMTLLDGPSFIPSLRALGADALRQQRWHLLAATCGAELSPSEAAELSRTYRRFYQSVRRAVPGAVALVRRLHRSARVGIVTNNELAEQESKLSFLGLGDAVDALVVSEEVGQSKPDREIFEVALRELGVAAEDSVMLGDSWTNDVLGARGAGIRPVWFNRFSLPRPRGPEARELRSLRPLGLAERLLLGEDRPAAAGAARSVLSAPPPSERR